MCHQLVPLSVMILFTGNTQAPVSHIGMGRLIAVHDIRGFKAHGSVHRRQFVYRVFFPIFINGTSSSPTNAHNAIKTINRLMTTIHFGDLLLSDRIMKTTYKTAARLSSHIL